LLPSWASPLQLSGAGGRGDASPPPSPFRNRFFERTRRLAWTGVRQTCPCGHRSHKSFCRAKTRSSVHSQRETSQGKTRRSESQVGQAEGIQRENLYAGRTKSGHKRTTLTLFHATNLLVDNPICHTSKATGRYSRKEDGDCPQESLPL
jgi:hypothetical protein